MLENENISSMYAHFNDIINALKGIGTVYTNHELVRKKKAMVATWRDTWSDNDDSSSDDEENEEIANIAFMAMENDCEVNTPSLSYNELQCAYDELVDVLNDLNRDYLLLKKIAKDRAKENVELKNCILEMKKDEGLNEKNSSLEKETLDLKLEIDALKKTF
ncbi:hypothetical protein CFOL_v3_32929 [Cephalotus follicularis]|uniref:UBN2 domain-containing protein n=1 Tax=Cephalotus follicularis TaxID=3775 RepID=A0A1Q3DAQ4_CEPFO|nr:hypothetical protein CFOL_v3_32929 [Cephalotus follicularis]